MVDDDDIITFGLSISQDLHDRAMAGVMAGEMNRSERIRELIKLGLAAEEGFEKADLPTDRHRFELASTIRQALEQSEFE